jgi:hypothetical protein
MKHRVPASWGEGGGGGPTHTQPSAKQGSPLTLYASDSMYHGSLYIITVSTST